ncbi:hypothetical protein [Pseudomonas putida]|uniref:hypothetical protein n=1 Tax=Pseudomonas putida TaxID=303 RepID=UPI00301BD87A
MDYSPIKTRFTQFVLNSARRAPYLFPLRIRKLAETYETSPPTRANRPLRQASLFYDPQGKIRLKGISLVIELSYDEIQKAQSWHERCKPHPVDRRHLSAYYSRSYLSAPRENILGQVSFGDYRSPLLLDNVEVGSVNFGCCVLSLVHIPSGSAYLNLYIATREGRDSQLQKIDISALRPAVQLESYNIFSGQNFTSHFSINNMAEKVVMEKVRGLQDEALRCATSVLSRMAISLGSERYVFKAWDFVNNAEALSTPQPVQPYRVGDAEPDEFIYRSYPRPTPSEISNKSIYIDFGDSKDCYNLMIVNSRKDDSFKSDHEKNYFNNAIALIFESALIISLTEHVYFNANKQRELLEKHIGFTKTMFSEEKKQKSLYKIIQNLTASADEITHLTKYRNWMCTDDFLAFYTGRLEAIKLFTEKVLERAELEYKFINDAIGMKIVKSNTKYSRILGGFALIQIILAYFAVDWSKQRDIAESVKTLASDYMSVASDAYSALVTLIF